MEQRRRLYSLNYGNSRQIIRAVLIGLVTGLVVSEDIGQLEDACLPHASQAHHSEGDGENVACRHPDKDGGQLQKSLGKMVQHGHDHQGEDGDYPVLPGAVARLSRPSGHIVDGCGIQGEADGKDHSACNQGWEKPSYLLDSKAHQQSADAPHNLGAQDGGDAGGLRDGLHAGHIGKAHAQNHGKAGP